MLIVGILTFLKVSNKAIEEASGISAACRNSAACMEAVRKQDEANANAAAANLNANAYELRVRELAAEIANKEAEIAQTEAEVEEIKGKIAVEEEKLEVQQSALAKLYVGMHFNSDDDTISILAGSESISDLAEKQSRAQVVKNQVITAVASIEATKAELEEDKTRVESMLENQKLARAELNAKKIEQENLVKKYKNDAAAFAAAAKVAKEEQARAEKAEQEAHPDLYRGSSFFGDNTYPWQKDCPGRKDDYSTRWNGIYIGGYVCECVSYVGWKAYEAFGLYLAWGNAYSWDDRARANGYRVDHTPAADTIGQTDEGTWGHVFWVESVNSNGSINVTEYNNWQATKLYSGIYRGGDFGARTIDANTAKRYNYIHF